VLALHGALDRARCLDCGAACPWPPMAVWRRCDLRCTNCQGPMSPGITPFGGAIDHAVARRLEEVATRCGLVLVLGAEAVEPATLGFLERVRDAGGVVAFVSGGGAGYPRRPRTSRFRSLQRRSWRFSSGALASRVVLLAGHRRRGERRARRTAPRSRAGQPPGDQGRRTTASAGRDRPPGALACPRRVAAHAWRAAPALGRGFGRRAIGPAALPQLQRDVVRSGDRGLPAGSPSRCRVTSCCRRAPARSGWPAVILLHGSDGVTRHQYARRARSSSSASRPSWSTASRRAAWTTRLATRAR